MELDAGTRGWIETTIGGEIISVAQQGRWRTHFFIDARRPNGTVLPLLLRCARTEAETRHSGFLQNFDITHEAAILSVLQGKGLAVPTYYGRHPDSHAILMERVAGSPDISGANDADRSAIMRSYIENLARLHSLDISESALPSSAVPKDGRERALGLPLVLQERDYVAQRPRLKPEPLLDFAIKWLSLNAPKDVSLCLIQGDTGPGQFMAHEGRLTALIDWEISHVGDPIYDLAVMRMRNMLYPVGEVMSRVGLYEEITGKRVNRDLLCFHTVSAMLQSPLGMVLSIQYPDTEMESMVPRFGWDVTLRRGLCDALCEAHGISVRPPLLPEQPNASRNDVSRFLVEHLEKLCLPLVQTDFDRFQMLGAAGLARAAERHIQFGQQIEGDNLRDIQTVVARPVADFEEGMKAIEELVEADSGGRARDALWLFSRIERRREFLWAPAMAFQQSQPLEMLDISTEPYEPS